jgi:hypothetical protein
MTQQEFMERFAALWGGPPVNLTEVNNGLWHDQYLILKTSEAIPMPYLDYCLFVGVHIILFAD